MALETLQGCEKLGEYDVIDMVALKTKRPEMFRPDGSMHYHLFERDIRPYAFIYVRHDVNSLSFTLQKGPIKEVGVNGCQVDALIEAAKTIVEKLNDQFPCYQNAAVVHHLDVALSWLQDRHTEREKRKVEGRSLA